MEQNSNPTYKHDEPLKLLLFSGSMRKDSFNTTLIKLAKKVCEKHGVIVDYAELKEFDCISMNQDLEVNDFHPAGAQEFHDRILANDAFILASPEYNGAMPGNVKNIIDWTSRFRPQPFNERHSLLMSASPSMIGGNRSLWSLRVPLEHLGARVFPDMFSLAKAHESFTPEGEFNSETLAQRFEANIVAFMNLVEAAKNYPCIKKAWVEFLGEQPDPKNERVE